MLTRGSAIVCTAAMALALAGCSAGRDGRAAEPTDEATVGVTVSDAPPPSAPASPSSPAASPSAPNPGTVPSASATGQSGRKLVTMTISGGFAGVNREVVLRGDGTVRTTDRGASGVRRTTAAQFTRLRTLLADPALDAVPASSLDRGAADRFRYTLQFDGRTVTTDRTADKPALKRLIDALETWLSKN
ncbi:protealysin inhibitor emfourin [Streptomyces sp. LUP30]|uniref:protealysin inhibitor emfourin n=1 Tax=Streptomyces sp. LUP30 TaxID=1890285 RepID=UPI00210EF2D3|nr:protealysin inhibitor emfourin [Streptomyces sp. LUP30]